MCIECPGCGEEMSARWLLLEGGLSCPRGCGTTRKALAKAVTSKYPHACYVFSDRATGEVKYVGVSTRLPERLGDHAHGSGRMAMCDGDDDDDDDDDREEVVGGSLEASLERAGEDLRVALHGCELAWWSLLNPKENRARPAHACSGRFRTRGGDEYELRGGCQSSDTRSARALDLETLGDEGGATRAHAVTPRCGIVATTDAPGMPERLRQALERHAVPCREMRKRHCDRRTVAHGYCRCRLPCDAWMRPHALALDLVQAGGSYSADAAEPELDMVAERDDDEATRGLVELMSWMRGSRHMREQVLERRARRFYRDDGVASHHPERAAPHPPIKGGQGRPWRLAPLRTLAGAPAGAPAAKATATKATATKASLGSVVPAESSAPSIRRDKASALRASAARTRDAAAAMRAAMRAAREARRVGGVV